MIFSRGPLTKSNFCYNENVKEFNYFGIAFSRSGSFCKTKKPICEQAQKDIFGVIRKIRLFNLPIS